MKRIFTLLTFGCLCLSNAADAQAPSWPWAKNAGGSGTDFGHGTCADAAGNTFVTGGYNSSAISFGTSSFTNSDGYDFFLTKYDASGAVVWSKTASGSSNDIGYAVALDPSGNIYVVGSSNSATLTFGTTILHLAGYDDIFVVKYDASGNLLWAKSAGGSANDVGQGISVDGTGNIYITGYFESTSMTIGSSTLSNTGTDNIFIAKYDASGTPVWAKKAGASGSDRGNAISTDAAGNSYITGSFTSTSCPFGAISLNNSGGLDMFFTKYDAAGNVKWARKSTGVSNEAGSGVSLDAYGLPHLLGNYNSSTMTLGSITLTLVSYDDAFVAKYDTAGTVLWANTAGGNKNDIGTGIGVDADGSTLIAGYFASASMAFGSTSIANIGINNMFTAKYDFAGNLVWAKSAGGTGDDHVNAIGVNWHGEAYITGSYTSSPCPIGGNTLSNSGGSDMFVAKLGTATGILETHKEAELFSIAPNPNNGVFKIILKESSYSEEPILVTVSDILGRTLQTITFNGNTLQLDLSQEPGGIYFVHVKAKELSSSLKMLLNH
jgi:hypothetical protein